MMHMEPKENLQTINGVEELPELLGYFFCHRSKMKLMVTSIV